MFVRNEFYFPFAWRDLMNENLMTWIWFSRSRRRCRARCSQRAQCRWENIFFEKNLSDRKSTIGRVIGFETLANLIMSLNQNWQTLGVVKKIKLFSEDFSKTRGRLLDGGEEQSSSPLISNERSIRKYKFIIAIYFRRVAGEGKWTFIWNVCCKLSNFWWRNHRLWNPIEALQKYL